MLFSLAISLSACEKKLTDDEICSQMKSQLINTTWKAHNEKFNHVRTYYIKFDESDNAFITYGEYYKLSGEGSEPEVTQCGWHISKSDNGRFHIELIDGPSELDPIYIDFDEESYYINYISTDAHYAGYDMFFEFEKE